MDMCVILIKNYIDVFFMQLPDIHNTPNDYTIDTIIQKYHHILIQYLNGLNYKYDYILDGDDIEDIIQDFYVKLMSGSLKKFRGECSLKNYLLHYVARSVFIDYLKKKYPKTMSVENEKTYTDDEDASCDHEVPDDDRVNPENIVVNMELEQIIIKELHNLTHQERVIFIMVEFDGLIQSKVAEILKIKQPTVSEHYNNARIKLQKLLKSKYPQHVDSIYYEK